MCCTIAVPEHPQTSERGGWYGENSGLDVWEKNAHRCEAILAIANPMVDCHSPIFTRDYSVHQRVELLLVAVLSVPKAGYRLKIEPISSEPATQLSRQWWKEVVRRSEAALCKIPLYEQGNTPDWFRPELSNMLVRGRFSMFVSAALTRVICVEWWICQE